jgi:hypothetical protein
MSNAPITIINILTYLNKIDKFNTYISHFITDSDSRINFKNIISNISHDDTHSTFINFYISRIYKNLTSTHYFLFFHDLNIIIKDYFFLINTLSLYISDLLDKYISHPDNILLKDKLPNDINFNILFNNIKLPAIHYLLFLFNLLLVNNKDLLKIYISYIFKISLNYKSSYTKTKEAMLSIITNTSKKFELLNYVNYSILVRIKDNYDNYLLELNNINILEYDDNKNLSYIFDILNINIIYEYTSINIYDKSLLLKEEKDIKNIYEILKIYLKILYPQKEEVKDNINNIYLTLSYYLHNILNE